MKKSNKLISITKVAIVLATSILCFGMCSYADSSVEVGIAPPETSTQQTNIIYSAQPTPNTSGPLVIVSDAPTEVENKAGTAFVPNTNKIGPGTTEPQEESKEESVITRSYTDEDLQYLTMAMTGECQNRSFDVQLKYGSVILNRVASPEYPNTIKEVCLQRRQYACFKDGNAYRTPIDTTREAAKWLLENGSVFPEYVVYQSRSRQGRGVYEVVQGEYFCY